MIPGDRRYNESTRARILRGRLVTFLSVLRPPEFALTVAASFLAGDSMLNVEGSS